MWLRPSSGPDQTPRWGHLDGIQVGLHPTAGPRGLLRIYTPYLGHVGERVLNFVAIEPIPAGGTQRGYSEMEHSALDGVRGKRFWSSHEQADGTPQDPAAPVPGVVDDADGVERLTVYVHSEPFDDGAQIVVRVRFRADRPREVALAAFRRAGSAELEACVLSATMGNFARLRRLHLKDRVVTPAELWPGFSGTGFADHARFGIDELRRDRGALVAFATPDEADLAGVTYSSDTGDGWKYYGDRAAQGWRVEEPSDDAQVLVNARWAFWASASQIPGGPAYENVDVVEPFRDGQEIVYWAEPFTDDADLDRLAALHGPTS